MLPLSALLAHSERRCTTAVANTLLPSKIHNVSVHTVGRRCYTRYAGVVFALHGKSAVSVNKFQLLLLNMESLWSAQRTENAHTENLAVRHVNILMTSLFYLSDWDIKHLNLLEVLKWCLDDLCTAKGLFILNNLGSISVFHDYLNHIDQVSLFQLISELWVKRLIL